MIKRGMKGTPEQSVDRPGSQIILIRPHPPFHAGLVESRLEEHPKVLEACALIVRAKTGQRRLVANVVTRDMQPWYGMEGELKAWLRDGQFPNHMIPYMICRTRELPLLPSGLVNRRSVALRRNRKAIERVAKDISDLPTIREPWNRWQFEGFVTGWERRGKYWIVEIVQRPAPVGRKKSPAAERLSIRVPPRFSARVRLGERLALRGKFYRSGWLLAEEVIVVPKVTRIGLENPGRVVEVAASG